MKLMAGEPQVMQNNCINPIQAQVIDSLRVGGIFFK